MCIQTLVTIDFTEINAIYSISYVQIYGVNFKYTNIYFTPLCVCIYIYVYTHTIVCLF